MIWDFLINRVPWQAQTAALIIFALIVLYVLIRIFGFERVKGWIGPVLAIIGAVGLLQRSRQQGYADRIKQEDRADTQARGEFQDIHRKNEGLSDDALDRKNDPWLK